MTSKTHNEPGMSCGYCVNSIEGSVGELDGVETVKVHLQDGKVNVTFNTEKVNVTDIRSH